MPSSRLSFSSAEDYDAHIAATPSINSSTLMPSPAEQGDVCLGQATASVVVSERESQHEDTKHERFYLADGNLTFVVEDTLLYNIHRFFFRDSHILSSHGSVLSPASTATVQLKGVSSREFDAFLSIICPKAYGTYELTTVEEWTFVLRLAAEWGFDSIRQLAIEHLNPMASAVDKIVLAHKYSIDGWFVPAYTDLCKRPLPLTTEEGRRLGVDDVILVTNMRESTRDSSLLFSEQEIAARTTKHMRPPAPPRRIRATPPSAEPLQPGALFSEDEVNRRRPGYCPPPLSSGPDGEGVPEHSHGKMKKSR